MKTNLEKKYRNGTISPSDLQILRDNVANLSDETLSAELEKVWDEGEFNESRVPGERINLLYNKIRSEIRSRDRELAWLRWAGIAAAVLIPLCIVFSVSNYSTVRQQVAQELIISTAKGEQSSVSLPDGTSVKLNELSILKYSPGKFGNKKRSISINGEAFFNVFRKNDCPFEIEVDAMRVTVLGTTFNLSARTEDSYNKLLLLEGSVELFSSLTGQSLILKPNEEATLYKNTGKVVVTRVERMESHTSWIRKELVLKRISLKEVLDILSDKYNVVFSCAKGVDTAELFTGTLPTDDLLSCTEILEYAFGVKIKISKGEVFISK